MAISEYVREITDEEMVDMFEPASLVEFLYGKAAAASYVKAKAGERDIIPQFRGHTQEEVAQLRADRVKLLQLAYETMAHRCSNNSAEHEDYEGHPGESPFDGGIAPLHPMLMVFNDHYNN